MTGTDDATAELVPLPSEEEIRAAYFDAELGPAALHPGDVTLILGGDDLRLAHFTEQVTAALHGDPRVLDLPPDVQEKIARISRVFETIAGGILRDRDPAETVRRARVVYIDGGQRGTPMRCNCGGCSAEVTVTDRPEKWTPGNPGGWKPSRGHSGPCGRVHHPLGGPPDWGIAGREDITCPACVKAAPKHAVKAEVVKPAPVKPAPRRRAPRRKPTGGAS